MNLLRELVETARETIASGYYRPRGDLKPAPSLAKAIALAAAAGRRPILAELKPATPLTGRLIETSFDDLLARFVAEGACGLSVLTEPRHFQGSLAHLRKAVATRLPVLMKDFVVEEEQIDCAAHYGASAVLLIASILPRKRRQHLIEYCHVADREVLLEVATAKEYQEAMDSEADLVGINNRDLRTFEGDLDRTLTIAKAAEKQKPLVSLSGFQGRDDVEKVASVADAFLVGTSLLDGTTSVKELVAP